MKRNHKIIFWLSGALLFFISLYVLRGVMMPFAAGMVLAYFLDPLADRLEKIGLSRLMSTITITVIFTLFSVLVVLLFIPLIQGQVFTFIEKLPQYVDIVRLKLEPILNGVISRLPDEKMAELKSSMGAFSGNAINWVIKVLGGLISKSMAFFSLLSLVIIAPIVSFYMLRDWDIMVAKIDDLIPRNSLEIVREQFREINRILSGFIRGQITVCIILGLFYGVGLTLVGLDVGLVVGLVAGVLSFIPYVGSIVGFILSMGLALAQFSNPMLFALVAGVFFLGQFIEGNFLTPKLVGDSVGLHPVWIIFALLAGGALFGFLGILIAVPVAAVIGVLVRFMIKIYKKSSIYTGKSFSNKSPREYKNYNNKNRNKSNQKNYYNRKKDIIQV